MQIRNFGIIRTYRMGYARHGPWGGPNSNTRFSDGNLAVIGKLSTTCHCYRMIRAAPRSRIGISFSRWIARAGREISSVNDAHLSTPLFRLLNRFMGAWVPRRNNPVSSNFTCLPMTFTPPARPECVVGSRVPFCASASALMKRSLDEIIVKS
jgi:hypothetical protein